MYTWEHQKINLNLKINWKINGGSVTKKTNDFLIVRKDKYEGWGEISASTKNNDLSIIQQDLQSIHLNSIQNIGDIDKLNICPQVRCGLEMAWINLECQINNISVYEYFKLKLNNNINTCFSIPILPINEIRKYILDFNINNYKSCKLKINNSNSLEFISEVSKHYKGSLRIDANESFDKAEEVLTLIDKISHLNIDFIEQPLHRTNYSESIELKNKSNLDIIGDESIQDEQINNKHLEMFHGVNIKLMKAGGYKNALKQINDSRKLGLKVLMGCMVETSLSISGALQLSSYADWHDLDGFLFFEKEPFNLLQVTNGGLSLN